ncbi:hypothetical protein HOB91_00105 [Candidatus Woesearchaeota archaeon]|jgi:uncharacterized membrane protein|nr:hypothetical protein [Candidatus Woesearchaeota archaeon]MBT6401962.1 hypothetical protein [Candidatus Woesearchaeota archaeon]
MKMTRHMKNIAFFVLALVALVGTAVSVSASTNDYSFDIIKVNGLETDVNTALDIERGERLDIEVWLIANATVEDVEITAKINGYEYGSISDSTGLFNLDEGKTYKKTLTLYVPEDIEASEDYTLRIEASDQNNEETATFGLFIDEQRHGLAIFDVLLNPSSTIAAGNSLFTTVRLENLGETEENDVKVTVSIPALGISTVNYLDELNTEFDEENEDHLRNDNSKQMDLLLRIPSDAATGTYDVQVDIEYNRGHSFLTKTLSLNVEGTAQAAGAQTVINSDSSSKVVNAGESVEYKVMMANLGLEPGVYSVTVDGVSAWGEAVVQPSFLTIMPDSTGEVTITVTPYDSVDAASHTWVAKVMLGTDVLSELVFTTKVEVENTVEQSNDTVKSVLTAIFFILLIVLVVLAIVIAFRKVRSDDDEDEETSALEGQTYYQYYPRN